MCNGDSITLLFKLEQSPMVTTYRSCAYYAITNYENVRVHKENIIQD